MNILGVDVLSISQEGHSHRRSAWLFRWLSSWPSGTIHICMGGGGVYLCIIFINFYPMHGFKLGFIRCNGITGLLCACGEFSATNATYLG